MVVKVEECVKVECIGLADMSGDVRVLNSRMDDFEGWQTRQNGSLQKMSDSLSSIHDLAIKIFIVLLGALLSTLGGTVLLLIKGF